MSVAWKEWEERSDLLEFCYEVVYADYGHDWERDCLQYVEMMVFRHNAAGIGRNGTVDKLIVVLVRLNQMKMEVRVQTLDVVPCKYGVEHSLGYPPVDVPGDDLMIFFYNIISLVRHRV